MHVRVSRWSMLFAVAVVITVPSLAAAQPSCQPGRYASQATGTCEPCDVGRYQPAIGQEACFFCEPGRFSDLPGQTACDACGPGRFQGFTGATSCQACAAGSARDATGQTTCATCGPGRFAALSGLTSCDSCAPGKFSDLSGATSCAACSPGRYATTDGSQTCRSCEPGRYADANEAATCKSCGPGKYSGGAEATTCDTCPPGRFSSSTLDATGETRWASACAAPNAYRCYKTKDLKNPAFTASEVSLTDTFASDTTKVKGFAMVCAPVDVGSGVEDASARQCCYKIAAPGLAKPHPRVDTSGGTFTGSELEVLKSQLICEPCGADRLP